MSEQFSESNESWFSRIRGSLKGVFFGLMMFGAAFPLLFWNEGRAVQTARSLSEGAGAVVAVASDKVDTANEGNLVHLTGDALTDEMLTDDDFGVAVNAVRLRRRVEMYQWVEKKEEEEREDIDGDVQTVTTYDYVKEWSSDWIDSDSFDRPQGHRNPSAMEFESTSWQAENVKLGAFLLSTGLIDDITGSTTVAVKLEDLPDGMKSRVALQGEGFYVPVEGTGIQDSPQEDPAVDESGEEGDSENASDPPADGSPAEWNGAPQIGDLRVTYTMSEQGPVSVIAQQIGESFSPYQTKAGDALLMLEMGTFTAEEMFAAAVARNNLMTWILRVGGVGMMFAGLVMVFKPLNVLTDVVPFFGRVVAIGTTLVAGLIAGALSLLTIGTAWLFFRPLIGVPLLLVGLAFGFWLVKLFYSKKPSSEMA